MPVKTPLGTVWFQSAMHILVVPDPRQKVSTQPYTKSEPLSGLLGPLTGRSLAMMHVLTLSFFLHYVLFLK